MSHGELALLGGEPTIRSTFTPYRSFGPEEVEAARAVVESGVLSQFLGAWHDDFYGGPRVKEFESAWAEHFGVRHAVTFNSWTSGLVAAVGAIGIEPGDEIIVSPWTMAATASAILHWNAIPVFADIDPDTYCLDPDAVAAAVTPHTRAILSVDIFGQSADMVALRAVADRSGLLILSDTAQAPAATASGKHAGTLADIGGFSLNYHKHIHTGEGGVAVTDDPIFAERMRLIRNHAEAVVGGKGEQDLRNMVGHNFRLGEIEAAIGTEQLKKLERLVASRRQVAAALRGELAGLEGLQLPKVAPENTHSYYVFAMDIDVTAIGVSRARIVDALIAEGVQGLAAGYQNLHLLPMYQQKIAFGSSGFPWSSDICRREVDYRRGICPVAERLHEDSFIGLAACSFEFSEQEVAQTGEAFRKVWSGLGALR